ncbi:unnamed protein product, partial [Symbiodinium microadriaticum]
VMPVHVGECLLLRAFRQRYLGGSGHLLLPDSDHRVHGWGASLPPQHLPARRGGAPLVSLQPLSSPDLHGVHDPRSQDGRLAVCRGETGRGGGVHRGVCMWTTPQLVLPVDALRHLQHLLQRGALCVVLDLLVLTRTGGLAVQAAALEVRQCEDDRLPDLLASTAAVPAFDKTVP